jgi:peptide/nickel transport system substrate-binding protein/oligopeptide transport system substrate-binding protein
VHAQDFVADWNYVTNPANQSVVSYVLAPIKGADASGYAKHGLVGVKALDDYTLQVTLNYSFAEFPQTLGHTVASAWPVDYMQKIGHKAFMNHPIGTGPFMIKDWVHNQYIDLVKNPNWWDKSAGGPYLDAIHFPIILDTNTEWLEFKTGKIDVTSVPPGQVASSENLPQVKDGTWQAKKWPSLAVYFIGMNQKSPVLGGAKNLPLRQALSYATNRDAVINVVNEGVPLTPNGIVPVGIPGANLSTLPYPYNPDKAKQIVSQLGTVPTLQYWYNTDPGHQKIAEALQAGWASVGIKVNLSNYEWGTYLSKLQQGTQDQLFRMGWIADYPSMDNFLYPLFQSEQAKTGSYTFYNNPQFDQLLVQARSTTDETQRLNLYAQAEKIMLTDAPCIPLYFYRDYRIINVSRVGGVVINPMYFVDMWKVWVK